MCLQSLQLTSFMMTVCNVVVVVIDWFVDANLLRYSFLFCIIIQLQIIFILCSDVSICNSKKHTKCLAIIAGHFKTAGLTVDKLNESYWNITDTVGLSHPNYTI